MQKEKQWEETLKALLPTKPGRSARDTTQGDRDLGSPLIIYKRASVPEREYDFQMFYLEEEESYDRYHWGTRCLCTECGEEFSAGYRDKSILMYTDETGATYPGWVDPKSEDYDVWQYSQGETVKCPMCGEMARATPVKDVKNGMTFWTRLGELTTIKGTTAIVYWIVSRYLDARGYGQKVYTPEQAVAVSPGGKLKRFRSRYRYEENTWGWSAASKMEDPEEKCFCPRTYEYITGSWYAELDPDLVMEKTTGEKTGIEDYYGLPLPATYLMVWEKHPQVENLVRTGWAKLVETSLERAYTNYGYAGGKKFLKTKLPKLNWAETKPARILGLSREEYRRLASEEWTIDQYDLYREYKKIYPGTSAIWFNEHLQAMGDVAMEESKTIWDFGLNRIRNYIRKQARQDGYEESAELYQEYIRLWKDHIRMQAEMHMYAEIGNLTEDEEFPPRLRDAHDRTTDTYRRIKNEKKASESLSRFKEMAEKYEALEWSDGKYCVVVPRSAVDLIEEGHVLHHCVGSYSEQHLGGRSIFFIRHARRPERSWFTLNENLTGGTPIRIQLHGYGNERNPKGEPITIPAEVLDFVDRWEREILAPWCKKQNKKSSKQEDLRRSA